MSEAIHRGPPTHASTKHSNRTLSALLTEDASSSTIGTGLVTQSSQRLSSFLEALSPKSRPSSQSQSFSHIKRTDTVQSLGSMAMSGLDSRRSNGHGSRVMGEDGEEWDLGSMGQGEVCWVWVEVDVGGETANGAITQGKEVTEGLTTIPATDNASSKKHWERTGW